MTTHTRPLLSADKLLYRADGAILLDHVSMHVAAGEVLGIVGPNGAGKSTLLKILAGVLRADAGTVSLGDLALHDHAPAQRARTLAYLEQRPAVHWPLSVLQVVALGRLPHGNTHDKQAQEAIRAALTWTDTDKFQERSFHTLSEGEKMRVNLARVLATKPRLILADEPTAALDPWHKLQLLDLLCMLAAQGLGIVLVLHDLSLAARYCDRLLLLDQGRMISNGPPADVLNAANLASIWHIDAELAADKFCLITRGRLP